MNKKISKKDTPLRDRYTGVLLEQMHGDIKQILEGHAVLDKKIDDFRYETRTEIKVLKLNNRHLIEKQGDLEVKMDKNFEDVFKYLSHIDEQIQFIRHRLDDLEKRVARLETAHI